ncbi:MAG: hypothetical protein NTV34_00990, partial [Proteobacteria bacterium]|nr:hypothetical protein [Pseudomonadota bacterium]
GPAPVPPGEGSPIPFPAGGSAFCVFGGVGAFVADEPVCLASEQETCSTIGPKRNARLNMFKNFFMAITSVPSESVNASETSRPTGVIGI